MGASRPNNSVVRWDRPVTIVAEDDAGYPVGDDFGFRRIRH
jgi:hypothetical protein